jgi:hypothetical protein
VLSAEGEVRNDKRVHLAGKVRRQPHFEGLLPYHTSVTGCDQRFLWSAQSTYLAVCSRTGHAMLPDGVESCIWGGHATL